MKKFAYLSDILFSFFLCGVCTLTLFRYLKLALPLALLLAAVCGALTALAVAALLRAKRRNLYLKKTDESLREKLLLHLALLSAEEKTAYFQDALSTEEEPVKRFGKLRIFNQTEFFFLHFPLSPLSADEIPSLARLKTGKKKVLLCSKIEENALDLCRRLDIEVKTGDCVYRLLKESGALPARYLGDSVPAPKRKFKLWLAKRNAKRFLSCGALILLFARLTPYSYYYLLFGGGLLLSALFIRIFGYE